MWPGLGGGFGSQGVWVKGEPPDGVSRAGGLLSLGERADVGGVDAVVQWLVWEQAVGSGLVWGVGVGVRGAKRGRRGC